MGVKSALYIYEPCTLYIEIALYILTVPQHDVIMLITL